MKKLLCRNRQKKTIKKTSKVTKETTKNDDVGINKNYDVERGEKSKTLKATKHYDIESDERNDDVESDEKQRRNRQKIMSKATK